MAEIHLILGLLAAFVLKAHTHPLGYEDYDGDNHYYQTGHNKLPLKQYPEMKVQKAFNFDYKYGMDKVSKSGGYLHKHIHTYSAPDDYPSVETRVIRPQYPYGGKHLNIIFVKAPSQQSEKVTEVILPEQPKLKTLIYVLLKKPVEPEDNLRIKGPQPTKPSPPKVFFVRYKYEKEHLDYDDNGSKDNQGYYHEKEEEDYGTGGFGKGKGHI